MALFALSRQDLQRWHYVDGLTPLELQEKYRAETGVYADRRHLVEWIKAPAQALAVLENNLDIHAHACGEYLLHELQTGVSAEVVAKDLLSKYLVRATMQRVVAYRHYREQLGEYWTAEHLERLHWDFLYSLVSLHKTWAVPKCESTLSMAAYAVCKS